ncbi:hypothetical protein RRG08_010564 [Elysia crispata]|uniref:Uncharacterized protein n=1 Tax=Elysia crispata TaxID=231223 RepID=A0AAE1DLQ4_9GAST|nr:hypothetical protein RRG08_010564 [Elysia crispata]
MPVITIKLSRTKYCHREDSTSMAGSKEGSPPCLEPVTTDEDDFHDMPTLEVQTDLDLADELHDHTDEYRVIQRRLVFLKLSCMALTHGHPSR